MSEDMEKPLAGEDAEAQPAEPSSRDDSSDVADAGPNTLGGPDAVEENVGGVQGAPGNVDDGTNSNVQVPPIGGPSSEPRVGGGEIEWSELGRQPAIDGMREGEQP